MSSGTFVDRIDPFAKRSLKKKSRKSQGSSRYRNSQDVELQQLPALKGEFYFRLLCTIDKYYQEFPRSLIKLSIERSPLISIQNNHVYLIFIINISSILNKQKLKLVDRKTWLWSGGQSFYHPRPKLLLSQIYHVKIKQYNLINRWLSYCSLQCWIYL
jgi:hypothetical protein